MNIGMIGAGKLGLPVALAIESKGYDVTVYDQNPAVADYIESNAIPYVEKDLQPLLDATKIRVAQSIGEVVASSDLIFLAVQTPHGPEYEGATPLPETRADFDYTYLKRAIGEVALEAEKQDKQTTLAVISTCLPGTFEREIRQLLNEKVDYVYTPQFIAMGTVLDDYLHPEFDLIGVENTAAADKLEQFYKTINDAPVLKTDITTAEGIKVSYNTFITMKTVLANTWGEMSERLGMDVDDIFKAWSLSSKRLLSTKYLKAGMSDGGGCHPRDNIALSHIAQEIGMSHNIFEDLMESREEYEGWHSDLAAEVAAREELPLVLLGKAFKPETNIQAGSPALLMGNILTNKQVSFRHIEDFDTEFETDKAVYFVATNHEAYKTAPYPDGSIVIDPFGEIEQNPNITVMKIGRK